MADLARSVAAPRDIEAVLDGVTSTAVELLSGADTAGVLLVSKGGKFESLSGTSELIYEVDRLQEKHNAGPCVDAAVNELVVRTEDFETETRWPAYSREVCTLGVRSSISFKLYTGDRTAGALNVFSRRPNSFDADSEMTARYSRLTPPRPSWPAATASSYRLPCSAGTSSARQKGF